MTTYFYLGCNKCKERVDAATKSGKLDEGGANILSDNKQDLPSFIVKHRNCGSLSVINENDDRMVTYSEFGILE